MPTAGPKLPRRLSDKIDGRDVYVADLVNEDLDAIDEIIDDYDELVRQQGDLAAQVKAAEDPEERKQLRAQAREISREMRVLDTRMLDRYVEDKDGERFGEEMLAGVPVRVQTALMKQATAKVYGDGEGPTPGTSANG